MTPDEARKLVGQYATGSLTKAERAALFSAALEDQDLFDELAGEHSLKELINSPGVSSRLLAALTPVIEEKPRRVWLPWAAVLACGIAAGTVWILRPRTVEAPVEVAQTSAPVAVREPKPEVVQLDTPRREKVAKPRVATPPVVVSSPTAAAPPPPADAPLAQAAEKAAAPQADPSSARGFAKGGGAAIFSAGNAFVATEAGVTTFAPLTYEFIANRKLRIVPAQLGILQVTVGTVTIFARNPVMDSIPIELALPDGALSVRIEFTPGNGTPFIVTPSVPQ